MRFLVRLCAAALCVIPAVAAVADGLYVSAGGGIALVPGFNDTPHDILEAVEETALTKGKADWAFDVGFAGAAALGYKFGPARTDAEVAYLTANFDFAGTDENGTEAANDTFTALSLMANFWYDLDVGSFLTPYVGVGVGATNLSVKLTTGDDTWFDGAGWGFAYQAGAGVSFNVIAGFSLDLGYRFCGTLETPVFDNADPELSSVTPLVMAHRIQLGLRFPT